jgi:SPP1 gp7 family putative phage head morphogenesis protein
LPNLNFIKELFQPLVKTFKISLQKEILEKSLDRTAGLELQEINPDPLLEKKGFDLQIYDTMMMDDRISMAIDLKKRLALSINADIIPASDDPKDKEIAEEVENQLKINKRSKYQHEAGYNFWSMLDNMMDAMVYGFKCGEKVFKIDGDKAVLHNVKFKHSILFDFDYDKYGNFDVLSIGKNYGETTSIEGINNIRDKFVTAVYPYPVDMNFYGQSDLTKVYCKWRSKMHIQRQRDKTLEKWGTPMPEALYDASTMTAGEINELKTLLDNFQEGTYLLNPGFRNPKTGELDAKIQFTIHEAKSGNLTSNFEDAIDQIDKQITRAILFPDKLGFSESPGGSYNQAETQLEILLVVIEYLHGWIEEIVNGQLIKQIVDLNFSVDDYPVMKFDKISEKIKVEILNTLIDKGVVDKREKWIRKHVGVPTITEAEQEEIDKAREEDEEKDRKKFEEQNREKTPFDGMPKAKPDDKVDKDGNSNEQPRGETGKEPKRKEDFKHVNLAKAKNPFDSKAVKAYLDTQEENFVMRYEEIMTKNLESVISQVEKKKIVDDQNLKAKDTLRMPKTELKNFLTQDYSKQYFNGKKEAISEVEPRINNITTLKKKVEYNLEGQTTINGSNLHSHSYKIDERGTGQTTSTNGEAKPHVHGIDNFVILPADNGHDHELDFKVTFKQVDFRTEIDWLDKRFIDKFLGTGIFSSLTKEDREALTAIRDRGFFITGVEEEKLLKEVKFIIDSGIRSGMTTADVVSQIRAAGIASIEKSALTIARTNISDWYNTGRMNLFTDDQVSKVVEAFEYQAIIDESTTAFCNEHDGQIIKAGDPRVAQINPPNHFNCRSILVPIMITENEDPDSFYYKYKEEAEQFGTGVSSKAVNPDVGFGGTGNK